MPKHTQPKKVRRNSRLPTLSASRPRILPDRDFPAYAYLPGRQPHPARDPGGHSYGIEAPAVAVEEALGSEEFRWGIDLFNHSYYWEAHEAWEGLWHAAKGNTGNRLFFKGLILLAAAGVKIRENKRPAAARHAGRAVTTFRQLPPGSDRLVGIEIGMPPAMLAQMARAVIHVAVFKTADPLAPEPVYPFILRPKLLKGGSEYFR